MLKPKTRVKHKLYGKGTVGYVSDVQDENNVLVWHDNGSAFYCKEEDLTILMPKRICSECGLDYPEDVLKHHKASAHGIHAEERIVEDILIKNDEDMIHKAEQYDRIVDMVFMSCGIIVDGASTQYLIDPATVCDELLKIIITDTKLDREQLVEKKQVAIDKEVKGW